MQSTFENDLEHSTEHTCSTYHTWNLVVYKIARYSVLLLHVQHVINKNMILVLYFGGVNFSSNDHFWWKIENDFVSSLNMSWLYVDKNSCTSLNHIFCVICEFVICWTYSQHTLNIITRNLDVPNIVNYKYNYYVKIMLQNVLKLRYLVLSQVCRLNWSKIA